MVTLAYCLIQLIEKAFNVAAKRLLASSTSIFNMGTYKSSTTTPAGEFPVFTVGVNANLENLDQDKIQP